MFCYASGHWATGTVTADLKGNWKCQAGKLETSQIMCKVQQAAALSLSSAKLNRIINGNELEVRRQDNDDDDDDMLMMIMMKMMMTTTTMMKIGSQS